MVPILKGGDFDQLYDLHHVRYLDTTLACVMIAFVWVAIAVIRRATNKRGLTLRANPANRALALEAALPVTTY